MTIAACAGSDSSFGLPGAGERWRKEQPCLKVPLTIPNEDLTLASGLPSWQLAIRDSTWTTRGWTYQEIILSRRMLFFTEWQVYFACAAMTCSESLLPGIEYAEDQTLGSGGALHPDILDGRLEGLILTGRVRNIKPIERLSDHLRAFTKRRLSREDDILNTFRGILSRSSFRTFYGIPVQVSFPTNISDLLTTQEVPGVFLWGLLWEPIPKIQTEGGGYLSRHRWACESLSRRSGFPSWSWAGWKGQVQLGFNAKQAIKNRSFQVDRIAQTKVLVGGENGVMTPLPNFLIAAEDQDILPELSPYIYIEAQVFQFRFQCIKTDNHQVKEAIGFCYCHPHAVHPGDLYRSEICETINGQALIFCQYPKAKDSEYDRMIERSWDCILLATGVWTPAWVSKLHVFYSFLIVDWVGETAYRVDTLRLSLPPGGFGWIRQGAPNSRRLVKLG